MEIFAVTGRLLRSNLKRPQQLIIMMLFPLFFTLVFGGLISAQSETKKYSLAVNIPSQDGINAELNSLLLNNPRLDIQSCSEQEARQLVRDRKVLAAVIVPADFAAKIKQGAVSNYTLVREEENNIYLAAKQEIDQAFFQIHTAAVTATQVVQNSDPHWQEVFNATLKTWKADSVEFKVTGLSRNIASVPQKSQSNVGFIIMVLMMSLVTSTGVLLQERMDGTWQRLIATPIRRSQILGGYLLGFFILGWIQFGILVGASRLLFNIYWGNPLGLLVLISIFILCCISLALALGGFVKTFQQQQAVATIVITATSMLGGVFWPLEVEPQAMQLLARGIPQYWATQGVNNLLLGGLDWARLALPLGVLSALTVTFFLIGVTRLKFE